MLEANHSSSHGRVGCLDGKLEPHLPFQGCKRDAFVRAPEIRTSQKTALIFPLPGAALTWLLATGATGKPCTRCPIHTQPPLDCLSEGEGQNDILVPALPNLAP